MAKRKKRKKVVRAKTVPAPLGLNSLTYSKICNTGNYENNRLEGHVVIGLNEDPYVEFLKLKNWVDFHVQQ